MRVAIFPGSFDPFTIGHADIIERGLPLFDKIVIAVGYNINKQGCESPRSRVAAIERLYKDNPKVAVTAYDDLTVDLARREGAQFILRGIRNVKDLEYERDIAATNRDLSLATINTEKDEMPIETVLIFTDPRFAHISSSLIRELRAFGKDVTSYLP